MTDFQVVEENESLVEPHPHTNFDLFGQIAVWERVQVDQRLDLIDVKQLKLGTRPQARIAKLRVSQRF